MLVWHYVEHRPSADIAEQWQARVDGRSVAFVRRPQCESPRCACGGSSVTCERRHCWIGVLVGPDGLVQDIDIQCAEPVPGDLVKQEVARALVVAGWEIADGSS